MYIATTFYVIRVRTMVDSVMLSYVPGRNSGSIVSVDETGKLLIGCVGVFGGLGTRMEISFVPLFAP